MADTAVRASSSNSAATGTALSVTAPAGTTTGDLVVVICHANGQTTIVDNNGSTPFAADLSNFQPNTTSGMTVGVFSRRIQAGDPGTYNFTSGATDRWAVVAVTLSNPDPSIIYDVAIGTANTDAPPAAASATIPSITTLTDKDVHIAVGCADGAGTPLTTDPAGYTPQQSTANQGIRVATKVITPAGSTGSLTMTCTTTDAVIGVSIAIKNNTPAAAGSSAGTFHADGPGMGPRLRRMMPQQFPTPGPVDTATAVPTSTPFRIGRAGTSGMPTRRMFPQQAPDTIPFVQDGSAKQMPFRIGRGGGIGAPTRRMFPQQYADTAASAAPIIGKVGPYSWAGIAAPLSVIIAATVGTYTWSGKTSRLSTEILGKVGAYTWAGKTSTISASIRSTAGAYTWAGKTSSIATSLVSRVGSYSWAGIAANLSGVAVVQEGVGAYTWAGVSSVLANLAPAVSAGGGASGAKRYRHPAWWGDEKKKKLLKKVEAVQLQIEKKREQIDLAPDLFRIQRLIEQIADLQRRMMKLLEQIDELNKLAGDEEAMLIYTIYRSLH